MITLAETLTTGRALSVSITTPCGYTLIEGAFVATSSNDFIKIVFPAATNPKLDYIPVGTSVSLLTEIGNDVYAYNGRISSLDERPFVWVKVMEQIPAMQKRKYRRISLNLPMYCSVVDESGKMTVIYDGKKDDGRHDPADLCLSAGGFKLKTPFPIKKDTMAITVFFSPDESEWIVPVFSTSVYSYPAPSGDKYLSGFKFSLIDRHNRKRIDSLVNRLHYTADPASKAIKYPSCLARITTAAATPRKQSRQHP